MKEIINENLMFFSVLGIIFILFIYTRIINYNNPKGYRPDDNTQKIYKDGAKESGRTIKKTQIYRIEEVQHKGEDDKPIYCEYRLFSKDTQGNKYMSERFRDLEYHPGHTNEQLKVTYKGKEYDLTKKEQSIKQIHGNINYIESELAKNPIYSKKMELNSELIKMKEFLSIINEGPNLPYVIINGNRVTVGDIIEVFIDPNNSSNYYFDV